MFSFGKKKSKPGKERCKHLVTRTDEASHTICKRCGKRLKK